MIISRWTDMGPEWKTEDIFRIRELFRENHISFRMPFSDLFFTSVFHMPEKDKRWGIRVREKDRSKAAALLIREVLCDVQAAGASSAGANHSFIMLSSISSSKKGE